MYDTTGSVVVLTVPLLVGFLVVASLLLSSHTQPFRSLVCSAFTAVPSQY